MIDVVYGGDGPTPADQARVREPATPSALTIVLGPDVVEPPPDFPAADPGPGGER